MEIIRMDARTKESKKAQYMLSKNPAVTKLIDCSGSTINVTGYMFYSDVKPGSENAKMIMTLLDDNGNVIIIFAFLSLIHI